jgi:prepilin-type N-terminal cleavage/methylation domain-containing protein
VAIYNLPTKVDKTAAKNAGFTIVELLLAIIVGAIMTSITSMIVINQSHISQRGRDAILSNSYAEAKIEGLRSAGYNNLTNATTDVTGELPDELKAPRSGSLQISDASTGIKQVDLTITYNDQGTPRTYSYKTYIGELGVGQN